VTNTLPKLLLRNAQSLGDKTAIREKRSGIWQAVNWSDHAAGTQELARGLAAMGFKRGDRLAVLGDNRRALYRAQLAAMCLGGIVVPCWPDADTEWLAHVLADAGVSILVAEDQDQLEKVLDVKDSLPALREVIYTDPRGVHHGDLGFLRSITDAAAAGAEGDIAAELGAGAPDDVCMICYVTPDSGQPVGVPLTHAHLLGAAEAVMKSADVRQTDEYFSYLPMAWVAEAIYGVALPLLVGFACSCPEDPETARRDLRELGPSILLAPPRIWQSLLAEIESKATHATPMKRRMCAQFLPDAYSATPPASGGFLAEWLVAAPLRDQLGLGKLRWAHTGGLAAAPHVQGFFSAIGVNLGPGLSLDEQPGMARLVTDTAATVPMGGGATAEARPIATALAHNLYIADAVVLGDGTGRLAGLIAIDAVAVTDWAQDRSLAFTTPAELMALPEVKELIREQLARGNAGLPANQRIERYCLLDTPPAATNAEASLSRVLQRRIALESLAASGTNLFADPPGPGVELVQATSANMRGQVA